MVGEVRDDDTKSPAYIKTRNNELLVSDGLDVPVHDAIGQELTATEDIWFFYQGGLAGTVVATVTVTYTDATKSTILNVVKT